MKPSPWVVKYLDYIPRNSKILDLACGSGRHSRLFIERGYHVTAVDRNIEGLHDLSESPNCKIIEVDLETSLAWTLPLGFGGIVVTNYLHRPILKHLSDALLPCGILIYQTFMIGNEKFGKPSNPDFLLNENELIETFEKEFDVISFSQGLNSTHSDPPQTRVMQQICAVKKS